MAKITIGKQKDNSESVTVINTSSDSSTEIIFKRIEDNSIRKIYIDDSSSDKKNLLLELEKLSFLLDGKDKNAYDSIVKAKESVEKNETKSMLEWLKKSGNIALEASIKESLSLLSDILSTLIL